MEDYIIEVLSKVFVRKINKRVRGDNNFLLGLDNEKRLLIMNKTCKEIYSFCNDKVENIIKKMRVLYPNVSSKKITIDVLRCLRDLEHRDFIVLR